MNILDTPSKQIAQQLVYSQYIYQWWDKQYVVLTF